MKKETKAVRQRRWVKRDVSTLTFLGDTPVVFNEMSSTSWVPQNQDWERVTYPSEWDRDEHRVVGRHCRQIRGHDNVTTEIQAADFEQTCLLRFKCPGAARRGSKDVG